MSIEVVFLGRPADGVHRSYPHIWTWRCRSCSFRLPGRATGDPAYGRVDDRPGADGVWLPAA